MCATCEAEMADAFGAPEFVPCFFNEVHVAQSYFSKQSFVDRCVFVPFLLDIKHQSIF